MAEQHNLSNDSTLAYLLNKSKPESIVDLIYPVGSIYMSMNSANPEKLFGGKWEQLPSGYFLESATSGAGDTVAAGLPNIKGSFKHNNTYSGSNVSSDGFSGALRSKAVSGTQYYLSGRSSGSGSGLSRVKTSSLHRILWIISMPYIRIAKLTRSVMTVY